MTKAPKDWDSLWQSSLRAGPVWQRDDSHKPRLLLVLLTNWIQLLIIPVYSKGCQKHTVTSTFPMAETTDSFLTGQQAKFSRHRTQWKENLIRPVAFLLMTHDIKNTDKKSKHLWEEKNQQTKSTLPNFPRIAESNELAPQIFSPSNLILENRERDSYHSYFKLILQANIWETDWGGKNLAFLPAFVSFPGSLNCSILGIGRCSDGKVESCRLYQMSGIKKFSFYPSRFFSLA